MHSFEPFEVSIFCKFFQNFDEFAKLLLDFAEILPEFLKKFTEINKITHYLQISINFKGCGTKPGPKRSSKPGAARLPVP